MKKLFCLLMTLTMILSTAAFAQSVPSKTTGDMIQVEIVTESAVATDAFVTTVVEETEETKQIIENTAVQIQKLQESASVEEYFGEVKNAAGEVVSLKEMLETEELNCFEFTPILAGGFEEQPEGEEAAEITLKMQFSTQYTAGEKVLVLIGIVSDEAAAEAADVTEVPEELIEWVVYEADVDEEGFVVVSLDNQMLVKIQDNNSYMAVVSKPVEESAEEAAE